MGHGTLIDGVQRTVKNGFDLVDGVQRKRKKGLALVDGVQREIGFAKMFTVTLTGTGWNATPCYIMINGVKYHAAQTLEVPEGTEIYCSVFAAAGSGSSAITVDGVGVGSIGTTVSGGYYYSDYTLIVAGDLTIDARAAGPVARAMVITTA